MSLHIQYVVDAEATEEEAPRLAEQVCDALIQQEIILASPQQHPDNGEGCRYATGPRAEEVATPWPVFRSGLDIVLGRNVLVTGENGLDTLTCPHCQHEHSEADLDWITAIGDWFDQNNESMTCPRCHHASLLPEWRFDPEWGFGYLGFAFTEWNLKPEFVQQISELSGHRMAWVTCHL